MPANLVHGKEDEHHWSEAKTAVQKQYPDLDEKNPRFWRLVTSIFERMKAGTGSHPVAKAVDATGHVRTEAIMQMYHQRHLPQAEPSLGQRILSRFGFGKATVKEPGKRGGKFHFSKLGEIRYDPKNGKYYHRDGRPVMVAPGKHATSLDEDRTRFNFGYHDAASEMQQHGGPAPIRGGPGWQDRHYDPVYVHGYEHGRRHAREGRYTGNSAEAWKESGREEGITPHRGHLAKAEPDFGKSQPVKEPGKEAAKYQRSGDLHKSRLTLTLCTPLPDTMELDAAGRLLLKAVAVPKHGALSQRIKEQIGYAGSPKREDMPEHIFLGPNRTYPVYEHKDGKWVLSARLLLAAARDARMHGKGELASRADTMREGMSRAT